MENLGKKWKQFFEIILDPWTLVLIISVLGLFAFSIGKTDVTITSLLFVLITLASAILGGRITKHWVDITEGGIVLARGKSAVRSLKLLLRNISALEQRVLTFIDQDSKINSSSEITERNYEEIRETCSMLEEEAINSIENWTDIVPEADIKTQIGIISDLKNMLANKESDLEVLKSELNDTKGKSEIERKQLKQEINKKENQIANLENQISKNRIQLGEIGIIGKTMEMLGTTATYNPVVSRGLTRHVTDVSGKSNITKK